MEDDTLGMIRRLCEDQRETIRRYRQKYLRCQDGLCYVSFLVGKSDMPSDQKEQVVAYIGNVLESLSTEITEE